MQIAHIDVPRPQTDGDAPNAGIARARSHRYLYYTAVKGFVAAIHSSDRPKPFEVRFETPPGHQAQVYFARFIAVFEDEPGITPIICLFDGALPLPAHRRCTGVISSITFGLLRMI